MAFFRFNRDKRGYEHFYLVEPVTNRRGKSRTRVLYWYRTPPNIRVGRAPFDEDVQRALEAQNPTVAFDWRKIVDAPIPSADVEKWRERRRVERAEKAARRFTAAAEEPLDDIADPQSPIAELELSAPADDSLTPEAVTPPIAMTATLPTTTVTSVSAATSGGGAESIRKRRRRRRGRGPRPDSPQTVARATADAVRRQPVQTSAPSEPAEQIDTANPTETPGD
jgi:hypothetical protein